MIQFLIPMVNAEGANNLGSQLGMFAVMAGIVVLFYIFAIRPQRKKDKAIKEMRAELAKGDRITTIGGIFGRVAEVNDDVITLEVGSDKTKLMIARWAVGSIEGQEENAEQLDGAKK